MGGLFGFCVADVDAVCLDYVVGFSYDDLVCLIWGFVVCVGFVGVYCVSIATFLICCNYYWVGLFVCWFVCWVVLFGCFCFLVCCLVGWNVVLFGVACLACVV